MGSSPSGYYSTFYHSIDNIPDVNNCDIYNNGTELIKVKSIVYIPEVFPGKDDMIAAISDQCLPKFSYVPYTGWHFYDGSVTPYETENWLADYDLHPIFLINGAMSPPLQMIQLNMIDDQWSSSINDYECYWWTRRITHINSDLSCRMWCHKAFKEIDEVDEFKIPISHYFTCSWDLLARLCVLTIHNEDKPCPIVISVKYKYTRTEIYGHSAKETKQECQLNRDLTQEVINRLLTEYPARVNYDPCRFLSNTQCQTIMVEDKITMPLCRLAANKDEKNESRGIDIRR